MQQPFLDKTLLEILHSGFEHTDVEVAGNVLVQTGTDTLGVAHLTEHTTVGRGVQAQVSTLI